MAVHLSPAVILTIITGRLHCSFAAAHAGLDALAGRKIWNFEIPAEMARLGPILARMLPDLAKESLPDISWMSKVEANKAGEAFASALERDYGRTIGVVLPIENDEVKS